MATRLPVHSPVMGAGLVWLWPSSHVKLCECSHVGLCGRRSFSPGYMPSGGRAGRVEETCFQNTATCFPKWLCHVCPHEHHLAVQAPTSPPSLQHPPAQPCHRGRPDVWRGATALVRICVLTWACRPSAVVCADVSVQIRCLLMVLSLPLSLGFPMCDLRSPRLSVCHAPMSCFVVAFPILSGKSAALTGTEVFLWKSEFWGPCSDLKSTQGESVC